MLQAFHRESIIVHSWLCKENCFNLCQMGSRVISIDLSSIKQTVYTCWLSENIISSYFQMKVGKYH